MKRIAVIFEGRINERMGVFNAVLNRVWHLRQVADYDIDVHLIQVYDGAIMRRLRRSEPVGNRQRCVTIDGIDFHMHWYKRSWRDMLNHRLMGQQPGDFNRWLDNLADRLADYDLIAAHDRIGGMVAAAVTHHHAKPHCITWHGTSIHTDPITSSDLRFATIELLHGASFNFFVSRELQARAQQLTADFQSEVLYNGASRIFSRFTDGERDRLRTLYQVQDRKVVAFVGRFEPIKNVTLLPRIFSLIAAKYSRPLTFWTIGTGSQFEKVTDALNACDFDCRNWGMQPLDIMPQLMNCIDVLVLPSKFEGLPLVTLEALQCGANVVASNVVGTAEGIGRDNAIDIDDAFFEHFTGRAIDMLEGKVHQQLPPHISWESTARKENDIYRRLMGCE